MAVLHVEHGVIGGLGAPQFHVDIQRRIHGGTDQGIASGIHADGFHQVIQRDDSAGALGHPHGDAILAQVHHLADEHLHLVRVIAQCCGSGAQAGDVPVVIRAEHVDAQVVIAVDLVHDVGDIARDVRSVAIGLDDHAVFVIPVLGGTQPPRALGFVEVAVAL